MDDPGGGGRGGGSEDPGGPMGGSGGSADANLAPPPPPPDAAVADAPAAVTRDAAADRAATPDVARERPPAPPPATIATPACPAVPAPPAGMEEPPCPFRAGDVAPWLPVTPPVKGCFPAPHPEVECPFYVFTYQQFMIATQPDAQARPAFLTWNTIENTFGAGAGQPTPAVPQLLGGITQAGGRQVLIDQRGRAIYYGIHINKVFVDFINAHDLVTAEAIRNADPNLALPLGAVELKEAWQVVDDASPPANFFTTKAQVPTLHAAKDALGNTQIVEDHEHLRTVTVALLAIHVVHALPGHPELVWGTFQHTDARGVFDVAPTAMANQAATRPATVISPTSFALYKGGTTAGEGNGGIPTASLQLDETTQTFTGQQTSVYRMFPASKSATTELDEEVVELNQTVRALFATTKAPASDKRLHYGLVGVIWQDRPDRTMKVDRALVNDETDPDIKANGSDSPRSIVGGEDRLSSIAMESFTQGTDSFPNCFSCHDTRAATARGVPLARDQAGTLTLMPKLINVSHLFNEVVRLGL
jgi:hypothetical protein